MFVRGRAALRVVVTATLLLAVSPVVTTATAGAASAATSPGTVWTWGSNSFGQLGNGTTSSSPVAPAAVSGLADVTDLHGGREHIVALTSTGQVYTWGSSQEGQLGLGTTTNRPTPTAVPGFDDVAAVETGHNHTLALRENGTVWTWGLNSTGQLGDGTTTTRRSPVQVRSLTGVAAIAAGRDMSYAIKSDGSAWAWGDNAYGELGDGTKTNRSAPVRVGTLTDVVGIAGGRNHGLALRADGSVWAFGWNAYGQLGDGTLVDRVSPVQVATGVREVAAGAHHSYALRTDGTVASWGRNYRAELGDGTSTTRTRPVVVQNVTGAVSIGSGRDHGVAVLSDGSVRTWGHNVSGQLGDGTTVNRTRAVVVPGVTDGLKAGGGGSEYSVILVGSGTPPPPSPPTAAIQVSCEHLACTFDGTGSSDQDGSVASYSWTYGDDSPDQGTTPVVSHTFARPGTYTVTLVVTDDDGLTDSAEASVTVTSEPPTTLALHGVRAYDSNVSRPSVAMPAGSVAGDLLLLFVTTNRAATATTPAGWTLRSTVSDGTEVRSWVFSRTAPASAGPVSVSLDAVSKVNLTVMAYAGSGAPVATGAAELGSSSSQHRSPSAPVASSGSTVVSFWADKVSTVHGWTLPPAVTSRSASNGTGSGLLSSTVGDSAAVSAGTWAGATATATGGISSAKAISWSVVLPPA